MSAAMLDGFNLLPYRARRRREVKRRRLALLAAASIAGCAAVGVVAGRDAFEQARLTERRAALEASLLASSAPVDEHARLVRAAEERRRARESAQPLAAPRERFLALLDALADVPAQTGVALQRVSQRASEVELAARAPDSQAAARWLKRLEQVRGVETVEVVEMKRRTVVAKRGLRGAAVPPSDGAEHYEFVALVRYESDRSSREDASRRARPVLTAGRPGAQGRRP
ncbi:PilN domain-containing protein [Caballeronia sp. LZ065]|uniref:PilN domain-containing protein n=1 Tax=Caballeronia sp. LZ065 TaxID=3038571 RepID=UPI00285F31A9|nr:PilN domain-containing protein [Caballeronia sp. LZ065]MDR5780500.1 PilN domain-containing protein [Caballeronia sp. LZ065]